MSELHDEVGEDENRAPLPIFRAPYHYICFPLCLIDKIRKFEEEMTKIILDVFCLYCDMV